MNKRQHRNRNKIWPTGKRRKWLGGRTSVGIIELIVEMVIEDGNVPALDVFVELQAIGVKCSLDYIKNLRSLVGSVILELQAQNMLKRKLIPDK